MEARLFINAGTHVVGVVDGTAEMTKCENGDITAATLRYAPTMRVRRKTAPIEPSTFQTFSPTFQLRIAIPPSTMCQTTTRNSDFWAGPSSTEEAKFLNLGREATQKSIFPSATTSSSEEDFEPISTREINLVRRIVSLPEGDQRAFADGRQLYDISGYPLIPVCAELDNRDWDLSTFDTSNCCDHADHRLAMEEKRKAALAQKLPALVATQTTSVAKKDLPSPQPSILTQHIPTI